LLVTTMANSGSKNENKPGVHFKAEMQDIKAELESAAGQDVGEPHHPPDHRPWH
jgi:hypothetical protein